MLSGTATAGDAAALVVSTYDLGRFPAEAWAVAQRLAAAGWSATLCDTSIEPFDLDTAAGAGLVVWSLPMHTATRLALPLIDAVRERSPGGRQVAFGLYAELNAALLARRGVDRFEGAPLVRGAGWLGAPPPLERYARLVQPDGGERLVGAVAASSGCRHRCRHCPVVPVFDGRFRAAAVDAVLAEVEALIGRGARHVTFTDPDFLNGPAHAARVAAAVHGAFPDVTFDVTARVDHLLGGRARLERLAADGCVLVTSAVESFDDVVLGRLGKDHRGTDVAALVAACRAAGVGLAPTFVPFTPWTTARSQLHLLDELARLGLVEAVPPVQLAIRLLVSAGSRLLELPDVAGVAGPFDEGALAHPWRHRDPAVDELAERTLRAVRRAGAHPEGPDGRAAHHRAVHAALRALTAEAVAAEGYRPPAPEAAGPQPATVPYLTEPWFC
ncbi:MAG: radical SAM protein [Acidimicrobiales bacterium]